MSTDTDGTPPSVTPGPDAGPGEQATDGGRADGPDPAAPSSGPAWLHEEIQRRIAAGRAGTVARHARRDNTATSGSTSYVPRHSHPAGPAAPAEPATPAEPTAPVGPAAPAAGPTVAGPGVPTRSTPARTRRRAPRAAPEPAANGLPTASPGQDRPRIGHPWEVALGPDPPAGPAGEQTLPRGTAVEAAPPGPPPVPPRTSPPGPDPRPPGSAPPGSVEPDQTQPDRTPPDKNQPKKNQVKKARSEKASSEKASSEKASSRSEKASSRSEKASSEKARSTGVGPDKTRSEKAEPEGVRSARAGPAPAPPGVTGTAIAPAPAPIRAVPPPISSPHPGAPAVPPTVSPTPPPPGRSIPPLRTPPPVRAHPLPAARPPPVRPGAPSRPGAPGPPGPVPPPEPAGNEPQTRRVRVVLAERKGVARPVRTVVDIQEGTGVGELLRSNLIGSQLAVALRFAIGAGLTLGLLPVLFAMFPEIGLLDVFGLRLPWLLLGFLVYPFLLGLGWWHTRTAEAVEKEFADHVQDN